MIYQSSHRITHKVVISATLTLVSPLRVGNGEGEKSQLAILRDAGGRPYLPGASFAGALRTRWLERVDLSQDRALEKAAMAFWGSTATEMRKSATLSSQSHFRISDMPIVGMPSKVVVRDGVRIDPDLGTAVEGGKYDYEVLEPGAEFGLRAEITVRGDMEIKQVERILLWLQETIHRDLQVGGNTTKGFGRLESSAFKCTILDFAKEGHADAWMHYCASGKMPESWSVTELKQLVSDQVPLLNYRELILVATFSVKSSLMIGGEGMNELDTDKAHLRSAGKPIISGKSLVGAMRQRTGRILATLGIEDAQARVDSLFGPLGDTGKQLTRSRLHTRETELVGVGKHQRQTRIRLDRFNAAPVDTGLFDSAPFWQEKNGQFQLWWRIVDFQEWEGAILLHLLRDLWTGDLAIGGEKGVGRGVLVGHAATLTLPNGTATIEQANGGLAISSAEVLDPFNQPLFKLITQSEKGEKA